MFDCAKEILSYHNDEVTLPQSERTNMRNRRNANRDRVKRELENNGDPKPREFSPQGSYAMKTMVQHPDNDYDIDDGIYFNLDDLKGRNGGDKSALEARQMVRDAVDDGGFKMKPEVRTNCVRIYYDAGYHVDMPVYRRVVTKDILGNEKVHYELASADWKRSDARDVTKWFEDELTRQSVNEDNGRQLRRMCRDIKKFSQSRSSWKGRIASGFMITKLVTECYRANANREDEALYYTMLAIRDRLERSLVVQHPVTPNEAITKENDDPKARFLKEKLSDAISWMAVLFNADCTREQALKTWDKAFNTDYFINKLEQKGEEKSSAKATNGALGAGILTDASNSGRSDDHRRDYEKRPSDVPRRPEEPPGHRVRPQPSFGED
jgi:hypothetical protein